MKKTFLSLIVIFILSISGYLFYDFKINNAEKDNLEFTSIEDLTRKEYSKTLSPKNLDPKSFIILFTEKYKKHTKFNCISMAGEFPEDWVKPKDVEYLISIMQSKQKCCSYMNIFSSYFPDDEAEIGGFAIIFLNSYISNTKINLGLACSPKTNTKEIQKIAKWYNNLNHKN
ncbi:hypothetical protein [Flavobacterium hydrophilum]|uniref:Uncharacterized protein n=1 Tax=Flavobacterium hydrophilum TaxID=2211445 RepID=A0A2V4C6U1_9FLAO|nr:hypothetical protein [Flavobacterium hydrophilum]PXY45660.1 hypothetical protein DMB68_00250 [Flavobacterium hydrophilum]